MQAAIENGVAGLSWADAAPGAHVARAALCYLHNQAEPGTSCPLTMTHAAVPVLQQAPALREWADKVAACRTAPRDVAIAGKPGVTQGRGMTEKQGGTDAGSKNTTATEPRGAADTRGGAQGFFPSLECAGVRFL